MILESQLASRVLHLTLNRPEKRNALNAELCAALVDAIEAAAQDPAVGAILLSGNGKAFCAGMDLSEVLQAPANLQDLHERLFTIGYNAAKPIVAAIHGACLAGGTGLIANCHVVIAADDASFGLTEIRLALWPFVIFRSMILAIGERRAMELALTGRIFPAPEAQNIGLVHYLADDPLPHARELAAAIASASPSAIQAGLRFVRAIRPQSWEEAGQTARAMRQDIFATADFTEGVQAFLEKRAPKWPSLS